MSRALRVTPLHEAASIGSAPVMNALLRGASASATYGEGETPLMMAARTGNLESVKLLIEAGANVNDAERFRGETALMLAAVENHAPVVQALVDAGAQVNVRTVGIPSRR
jgi:ankyrin repeat protein